MIRDRPPARMKSLKFDRGTSTLDKTMIESFAADGPRPASRVGR
jgi:hypothetical protein